MKLRFALPLFVAVFLIAAAGLWVRYADGEPYAGGYTVKIASFDGVGSGFHIGEGYIITANHVVAGLDTGKVYTDMGAIRSFTVMWRNENLDIALLLVTEPINLQAIDMDCSPHEAQDVVLHGLPHGIDFTEMAGHMSDLVFEVNQPDNVHWDAVVFLGIQTIPGMSGGPVVSRDGDAVGVVVGAGEGYGVAVPMDRVCLLLPQN